MHNVLAISTSNESDTTSAAQLSAGTFNIYPLSEIRISRTNRKRFNPEALEKLSENIKKVGVIQPILIRPVSPTEDEPEFYEIVAGERRYRASVVAGAGTIPAMCRALGDMEAMEIQIIENLQREDPHPMEEAEGYQQLMIKHGYTADQLAEKIDKSRSYIYGRLKLCALTLTAREKFLDDKISASIALLLARIPVPALQTKAMSEVTAPSGWPAEPMSYRRAAEHIQKRYMLDLNAATFMLNDAKLLATAGSCVSCPKRAGNQPELYPTEDVNLCTDPDCFTEKRAAHDARKIVLANKRGIPILEGTAATAIFGDLTKIFDDGCLWKLDRLADGQSNSAILNTVLKEGQLPQPIALLKMDSGTVRAVYDKAAVQAAAEAAGLCETHAVYADRMALENKAPNRQGLLLAQKKREEEATECDRLAEAETNRRVTLYKKLRQRGASGFSVSSLRELVKSMVNTHSLPDDLLGDLYCFPDRSDDGICAYIDQAPQSEVQLLLVDLILGECLGVASWQLGRADDDEQFATIIAMAKHEGIDPDHMDDHLLEPLDPMVIAKPPKVPKTKKATIATLAEWPFPKSEKSNVTVKGDVAFAKESSKAQS